MEERKMDNYYNLGSSTHEQNRLNRQRDLYNDSKYLEFTASDTVCEIGCGPGVNLWIAQKAKHGKFIGIDIQKAQIDASIHKAQQLGLKNVEFYCANSNPIPLQDNSVDMVFCRLVLIHLVNPEDIIAEMYRIIKPGGKIILIEPDVKHYYTTKPYLQKCYQARCRYSYCAGRGSIDITQNLNPLLQKINVKEIKSVKHEIHVTGKEKEKMSQLLSNWLIQITAVVQPLIQNSFITELDYKYASEEIEQITEDDYIYQPLMIMQGKKPGPKLTFME